MVIRSLLYHYINECIAGKKNSAKGYGMTLFFWKNTINCVNTQFLGVDAVVDKTIRQCYIIARCNNFVTNEVIYE